MLLSLAGEENDPEIDRLLEFGRQLLQHRHAAADMEAADRHRDAPGAKLACDRHGARKLVRLDPDEADDARVPRLLDALAMRSTGILMFISSIGVDLDRDVFAQRPCGGRSPAAMA